MARLCFAGVFDKEIEKKIIKVILFYLLLLKVHIVVWPKYCFENVIFYRKSVCYVLIRFLRC